MEDRKLYFLVKFGQYTFMKQLFDTGSIYMQRLRAFQDVEHDQIGDKNEGLSHALQPSQVALKINDLDVAGIVGPIRIVETNAYNPLIFCLYGFTNDCIDKNNNHIDARCCEFGDYAVVITDVKKFYQMIGDAFKNVGNGTIKAQLVEYVSYNEHHGEMGPFRKYDNFSHQSEFRFVYEDKGLAPTDTLEIGCLDGVAILCPSDQVNDLIKINA
jgi:hypothetical protein